MFRLDAQEQGFPFTPASPNTHGQEYSQRIERITNCFFPSVILAFPPSVILAFFLPVILAFFRLSSSPSSFCHCLFLLSSSPSSFCHPRRLSPTFLIGEVVKDPVSLPFPSFVRRTTLDSCFRRNDSRLPFSLLCSGGISCRLPLTASHAAPTTAQRGCPVFRGVIPGQGARDMPHGAVGFRWRLFS